MSKNFAGQNLNDCSFRGQDLRGADFSGCQLKSCDFRDADLTGAKFCGATLGVDGRRKLVKWGAAFVLGMACGFLTWFLNFISAAAVIPIYQVIFGVNVLIEENDTLLLLDSLYAISICLSLFAALKYRDWRIVTGYFLVIIIAAAVAIAIAVTGTVSVMVTVVVFTVVGTAAVLVAIVGAVVGAVVAAGAGAVAVVGAVAVAVAVAGLRALAGTEAVALVGPAMIAVAAIMTFIYLLLGWYLNRRCLKSEEPMLAILRRYALAWHCWGGTQFSGAVLAHTDFSEADLTAARFAGAHFQQPNFIHAKNLHLAWTYASPLEYKPVRALLTEGTIDDRDFSNFNLRGLSFKGLSLSGCNFYHADLSEADFSGCDLTGTDLSEAMVLGTRFSNATMTGALIDNWSMDKQTQFDGVICDFVFTKRNKDERNPPDGTFFKPSEFSKLYQEIANTVDFIAHTPDELTALLRAIDHIKQQGGDIVIQSLERKNESVVVRTQSDEGIDKAAIYAEVKEQVVKEMYLLQQQHATQLLQQKLELTEAHHQRETELRDKHDSLLAQFVNKAIENPKVEIMNDNSRRIEHASINHSAVNLGDHSTVSNHIEQVADAELKAALQTLQQLLADSHLADIDKQQAHQAVDELAAVSQKPQAERKSLARRSLSFLKDLQQDLSSVAELGEQYGKLLIKVMAWF
ncbi:MAG: pentapeptide repeat-containing protein [Proteobacteria bacterium]|nr:pentapeptide repeat-containing protein [Pseudomonadota bacterium]